MDNKVQMKYLFVNRIGIFETAPCLPLPCSNLISGQYKCPPCI